MSTIKVGNIERNYFTKQPGEKYTYDLDFTEELGSGVTVIDYVVHATDQSGTSVDTTVLAGYTESSGVLTVGVKGGTAGKVYTLTATVTASATLPNGNRKEYEGDIFMRVEEKNYEDVLHI